MRGRGKYHSKKAEETASAVYWTIWEFGAINFNNLFRILKSRGKVKSTRTLSKALKRLLKRGLIKRENALIHLHEKTVLNPPIMGQFFIFGRYEDGKFIPDKTAPIKLLIIPAGEPTKMKSFSGEFNKILRGARFVYMPRINVEIRG